MRNLLLTAIVLAGATPAARSQEKEYVLDTATNVVSVKDKEQDSEIASMKAKIIELEKLAKLSRTMKELEAAAPASHYPTAAEPPKKTDGCVNCGCLVQKTVVARPAPVVASPVGHTHTCPRCGTTWDHSTNPGHNCPKCGTAQYVQDSHPRPVAVASPGQSLPVTYQAAPIRYTLSGAGGCANGSCSSPQRFRIFGNR